MGVNKVELSGGLTREPELFYTDSGFPIWGGTLAVSDARWDGKEGKEVVDTVFVRLQAFGWQAEHIAEMHLLKGEQVYVSGQLDQREVETKDGEMESKTRVTVLWLEPIRRKREGQRGDSVF